MSVTTVARRFVELCSQGKNFDVMRTMYSPDIVSVENGGEETKGQQAVIQKSEKWAAGLTIHGETVRGPYFNGPTGANGQFAVFIAFDVTPQATGKRVTLEEVALYTVKDDLIVREQFFYEGSR